MSILDAHPLLQVLVGGKENKSLRLMFPELFRDHQKEEHICPECGTVFTKNYCFCSAECCNKAKNNLITQKKGEKSSNT